MDKQSKEKINKIIGIIRLSALIFLAGAAVAEFAGIKYAYFIMIPVMFITIFVEQRED